MLKIILVRHAQTIKNREGIAQSLDDSDLTKEGYLQLEKTKEFLKNYKIDVVFCSSLERTVKSAEYIAKPHNLKPILDNKLNEINWGDFSGLSTAKLLKKWSKYYEEAIKKGSSREDIKPPNGENCFDHMKRIKKFLDFIIKNYFNKTVLVVGHGGTNKVIIGLLKEVDTEKFYDIKQDNACINFLDVDSNRKLIRCELNITKHLE